jgi:hypothetical protein
MYTAFFFLASKHTMSQFQMPVDALPISGDTKTEDLKLELGCCVGV